MTLAELGMAFWHDLAAPVIAGILASMIVNWLNNILVNSNLRDRGLCWQVQQDLYRDMRRRPVMLSGAYLQRAGVFSLQQPMPPGIKPPQHCASPEPFRLASG